MIRIFCLFQVPMLRWLTALIVVLNIVKYVYIKVPDNAEEPWKVRLSSFGSFFSGDLVSRTLH